MRIHLNGAAREMHDGLSVADLIEQIAGSARGTAAVVDGHVVPRSAWPATALRDGQSVELITAVQGG